MKKRKKALLIFAVVLFVLYLTGITAFAAASEQDGLEVTLVADKDKYKKSEQIISVLTVKNTNSSSVTDVLISSILPEGYVLAEESEAVRQIGELKPGETVTLVVVYAPDEENANAMDRRLIVVLCLLFLVMSIIFTIFIIWLEKKKGKTTAKEKGGEGGKAKKKKNRERLSVFLCAVMASAAFLAFQGTQIGKAEENQDSEAEEGQDSKTEESQDSKTEEGQDSKAEEGQDSKAEEGRRTLRIEEAVWVGSRELLLSVEITYLPAIEEMTDIELEKYSIDIMASYGGKIVQGVPGEYETGSSLEVEALPEEGWAFVEWVAAQGGEIADPKSPRTTFVVPEHDAELVARFEREGDEGEPDGDELDVYLAYYALEIGYAKGDDSSSVTGSLILPEAYGEEGHRVDITWSSSDERIVSPAGEVSRPADADETVRLTASLRKGEAVSEKEFLVKVICAAQYDVLEIEDKTALELEEWNEESEYPLEIDYSEDGTQVTFISGKYSDIPVDSAEAALHSIYSVKSLLGLSNPGEELQWQASNHDGMTRSYTFSQLYQGIPVYGAAVTVNAQEDSGEACAISSSIVPAGRLEGISMVPQLSAEEISQKYQDDFSVLDSVLLLYVPPEQDGAPVLAYSLLTEYERVVVSAVDGEILLRYSTIYDWGDYSTTGKGRDELGREQTFPVQFHQWDFWFYYMEDVQRRIYVRGDKTGPITHEFNTEWKDGTAVSAYTNVIRVYDWYKTHLGRNSIDNNGMKIIVNVHDHKGEKMLDNAHWEGSSHEMCFFENSWGGTPTTAAGLDIIAHEMTHGMFQSILGSNGVNDFPYAGYTGSINEGYADVFGYFVDNEDWEIGEAWQAIRDLSNPGQFQAPSKLGGEHYYTGTDQDILVHTNSSLVYHAAYLMHSYGITGSKLEKLWYNSMSQGYDRNSTFHTVRRNLIRAAKNNHFTDEELANVRKAFDTEEIYDERGSLALRFVDADGEPANPETPLPITITLSRDRKDVPEPEYGFMDVVAGGDEIRHERIYFGNYQIAIEIAGYSSFQAEIKITKNKATELVIPLLKEGTGVAGGEVTSATTGYPVEEVALKVLSGWNQESGEVIAEGRTALDGTYAFELPAGFYTLVMEKEEYTTGYRNITVNGGEQILDQNASISPTMVLGRDFRVVLSWGENPSDLDSHLFGSLKDGKSYHVYYSDKNGYDSEGNLVANLDVDDTSSYGPETVTFTALSGGTYEYYIHWYAGYGTWATSGGKVEVYNGNRLIQVFTVPAVDNSSGRWKVFGLVNGIFIPYNAIQ